MKPHFSMRGASARIALTMLAITQRDGIAKRKRDDGEHVHVPEEELDREYGDGEWLKKTSESGLKAVTVSLAFKGDLNKLRWIHMHDCAVLSNIRVLERSRGRSSSRPRVAALDELPVDCEDLRKSWPRGDTSKSSSLLERTGASGTEMSFVLLFERITLMLSSGCARTDASAMSGQCTRLLGSATWISSSICVRSGASWVVHGEFP